MVQTFDAVFTITSGGLGTANLPYTIYQTFYSAQDYGRASAAGVVVVIGTILIATFALRTVSTLFRGGGPMSSTHRRRHRSPRPARPPAKARKPRKPRAASRCSAYSRWLVGLLFVMPSLWMVLTSFHSEADAATNPPVLRRTADPRRLPEFFGASSGASPWPSLLNSMTASVVSTLLVLLLAFPAAYALSIRPVRKWTDVMFFFLSTKMLPVVAGLLPIYLFAQKAGLLDNIWLLIILYTVDEPADRDLDDAVVPRRGSGGDARGRVRWTAPAAARSSRTSSPRSSCPASRRPR